MDFIFFKIYSKIIEYNFSSFSSSLAKRSVFYQKHEKELIPRPNDFINYNSEKPQNIRNLNTYFLTRINQACSALLKNPENFVSVTLKQYSLQLKNISTYIQNIL